MNAPDVRRRIVVLSAVLIALSGCNRHRLGEYDYTGAALAVECDLPPYPEVLTGPLTLRSLDPVRVVLDATSRAAREMQVGALREKLDSAVSRVDLEALVRDEVGRRASRYMGSSLEPAAAGADFLLRVTVLDYGIRATDWDATAYFFVDAEAILLDSRGYEIWRTEVGAQDPLGPELFGPVGSARGVVTAVVLAGLSVNDLARTMEQLADFTAREVTDELRDDLRGARRRR